MMAHKAGPSWAHHFVDDEIKVPLTHWNGSGSLDGLPIHPLFRREAFVAFDINRHTASESRCPSQLQDMETYTRLQPALRLATQLIETGDHFLKRVAHASLIRAYPEAPISQSLLAHTYPFVSATTWRKQLNDVADMYIIYTCHSSLGLVHAHTHTRTRAPSDSDPHSSNAYISSDGHPPLFYGCTIPTITPPSPFQPSAMQIRSALREELIFELQHPRWYSHPYPQRCAILITIAITLFHELVHAIWLYRFLPEMAEQLQREERCDVPDEPLANVNDVVQQNELGVVAEYEVFGCEMMMAGRTGPGGCELRFDGRAGLVVNGAGRLWRVAEATLLELLEGRTWERNASGRLERPLHLWFVQDQEGRI